MHAYLKDVKLQDAKVPILMRWLINSVLTGDDTPTAWGKNNQKVAGRANLNRPGAQNAKSNQKSVSFNQKGPDTKTAKASQKVAGEKPGKSSQKPDLKTNDSMW